MEKIDQFKEKVFNLYHTMVGLRSMILFRHGQLADQQLFDIACNAVSAEDQYFMDWLSKNQDRLTGCQAESDSEDNKQITSMSLDLLFLEKALMIGHHSVKVNGYEEMPIALAVNKFMEEEQIAFDNATWDYLIEKSVDAVRTGCKMAPYLKMLGDGDKKTLMALDLFNKEYYRSSPMPLFSFLYASTKQESYSIEHLFTDFKIHSIKKRQAEIREQIKEIGEGDKALLKELLTEYQENISNLNRLGFSNID